MVKVTVIRDDAYKRILKCQEGNRFLELPINYPMEKDEMAIKIHDIQRMIISRPGFRLNQEMFRQYGKGNSDKG